MRPASAAARRSRRPFRGPRGDPRCGGRDRRGDRARARARADRQARTRARGRPQPRDHAARRPRAGRARERRSRRGDARRAPADRRVDLAARCSSAAVPSGSPTSPRGCGSPRSEFGVADAQTALLVPMVYRGEAVGVLAAFDRGEDGSVFSEDDEQMLRTFAASAATAVALAQSVQADRLRSSLAAADAERRRWARELHDETLQGLGGLRVLLSSALRRDDLEQAQSGDARGGRAHRAGDREPARDHHRAAPGGAGRAGAARPRSRPCSTATASRAGSRSTPSSTLPGLSTWRRAPRRRSRDHRLPPRAGGAHERRQARARRAGARGRQRVRRRAARRGPATTAGASTRRRGRRLRPGRHARAGESGRRHLEHRLRRARDPGQRLAAGTPLRAAPAARRPSGPSRPRPSA